VAAVGADNLVFTLERQTGADGSAFLTDRKMHRAAHLLIRVTLGDALFDASNSEHAPIGALE
jgi:hypothetical protein